MANQEAAEIRITGRVQGVGFRFFTYRTARSLSIRGWVKNMPDGSVLVQAAGPSETMARFRKKLGEGPTFGRVDDMRESPLAEERLASFPDFQIIH